VEYRKDREFREQQEQLTFSAQDAAPAFRDALSRRRHKLLGVLTNETNYFDAELGLAQAQSN